MVRMIEHVHPGVSARHARVVLFDFDGTISLIRAGWVDVMVPMMVEILTDLKTGESEEDLRALVTDFVGRLTGKQTMYQMMELAEPGGVARRQAARSAALQTQVPGPAAREDRRTGLKSCGRARRRPTKYLVPGARQLLEALSARGLKMYLASGTDQQYMREEADLLDVSRYFDGRRLRRAGRLQELLEEDSHPADHRLGANAKGRSSWASATATSRSKT